MDGESEEGVREVEGGGEAQPTWSGEEVERRVMEARQEAQAEVEAAQRLAEEHEQALAEARPLAAAATRYQALLNATIGEEVGRWPEEVRALDPGPERLEERLAWMTSARALAERLTVRPKAAETEAGAGNRPSAEVGSSEQRRPYRFQNAGDVTW